MEKTRKGTKTYEISYEHILYVMEKMVQEGTLEAKYLQAAKERYRDIIQNKNGSNIAS